MTAFNSVGVDGMTIVQFTIGYCVERTAPPSTYDLNDICEMIYALKYDQQMLNNWRLLLVGSPKMLRARIVRSGFGL